MINTQNKSLTFRLGLAVVVGALGYCVDVYDMMIFSVVRLSSLTEMGVPLDQLTSVGLHILNWQLIGMLIGGLLWGVFGDKKGRVTVLFGSIFIYSVATLACAFVTTPEHYTLLRFIAGIGLAGELGASVTLVSELLPRQSRGYGTMIIACSGASGAVMAGLIGHTFSWKSCYLVGGFMGFGLLAIRIGIMESGLFKNLLSKPVARGNLSQLFGTPSLLTKYLRCLFLAIPAWILIGLFTTLAPEIGKDMGFLEPFAVAQAVLYLNIGIVIGDCTSSLVSQWLKSRKKTLALFLGSLVFFAGIFGFWKFETSQQLLWIYLLLGICAGYWAVFIVTTAEQFGTNLRATVATSTPNFVRAAIVPISLLLEKLKPEFGVRNTLTFITLVMLFISFYSLSRMKETFTDDLDFIES